MSHSYVSELAQFPTVASSEQSILFSDSSQISVKAEWQNLLHTRTADSLDQTLSELSIARSSVRTSAAIVHEQGGFGAELIRSRVKMVIEKANDVQGTAIIEVNQPVTSFSLSAWVASKHGVSVGLTFGMPFSPAISTDTSISMDCASPLTTMRASSPVAIHGVLKYTGSVFHCGSSYDRTLAVGAVPQITMNKSGHFRTFPISMMETRTEFSGGIHRDNMQITLATAIHRLDGKSFSSGDMSLPIFPEMAFNESSISAKLRRVSADVLYRHGKVSLVVYDNPNLRSRFIRFGSNQLQHIQGSLRYSGIQNAVTVSAENIQLKMNARGYVDLYPFSTWTIFRPFSYRFSEGSFGFVSGGAEAKHTKQWNNSQQTTFTLGSTYAELSASIYREKKKLIVLIPIYNEDTLLSLEKKRMIIGDLTLSHTFSIRSAKLECSARQLIPIILKEKSTATDAHEQVESTDQTKTYGGLTLLVDLKIPFSMRKKECTERIVSPLKP